MRGFLFYFTGMVMGAGLPVAALFLWRIRREAKEAKESAQEKEH